MGKFKIAVVCFILVQVVCFGLVQAQEIPLINIGISPGNWNPEENSLDIRFYLPDEFSGVVYCAFRNSDNQFEYVITQAVTGGKNHMEWNGRDETGEICPRGNYDIRIYFSPLEKESTLNSISQLNYWSYNQEDRGGNWVVFDSYNRVLWCCDPQKREILRLNPQGDVERKWQRSLDGLISFRSVVCLAVDPEGKLLVADDEDYVVRGINCLGGAVTCESDIYHEVGADHIDCISSDPAGNLYIGDNRTYRIRKVSPTGETIQIWGSYGSGSGQFASINALYTTKNHIYVVDGGNHRIQVFSLDGLWVKNIGSYGTNENQLFKPRSLVVDQNGIIYIADRGNLRVKAFTSSGQLMQSYLIRDKDGKQLIPSCLAYDPEGYLWIGDFIQGLLVKVMLPLDHRVLQERDQILISY